MPRWTIGIGIIVSRYRCALPIEGRQRGGEIRSLKVLWRLRSYPLRYKRRTATAYLCTALSIVAAMFVPALLGAAIDDPLAKGLRRQQLWLAAGIVGASAVRGVFGCGQNYLIYSTTEKVSHDLRNDIFNTLLGLSFGFYDRQRTGSPAIIVDADQAVLQGRDVHRPCGYEIRCQAVVLGGGRTEDTRHHPQAAPDRLPG